MSNKTENLSPEQAIQKLEFASLFMGVDANYEEYIKAVKVARDAVERLMIAKKPDYEGDGYDDKGELIYDTAYCPNCRHMFEVDYDVVKHCPDCGQLIDWGGRNENAV